MIANVAARLTRGTFFLRRPFNDKLIANHVDNARWFEF